MIFYDALVGHVGDGTDAFLEMPMLKEIYWAFYLKFW